MELTSLHKKQYGRWAGSPNGTPAYPERCCEEVYENGRWPLPRQCNKKRGHGPEGAYCKQHDPEVVAARRAKSRAKEEAAFNKRVLEWAGPAAVALLRKIAEGHNDPRTAAREFLESRNLMEDKS